MKSETEKKSKHTLIQALSTSIFVLLHKPKQARIKGAATRVKKNALDVGLAIQTGEIPAVLGAI